MSKVDTAQQDKQSKQPINKPVHTEMPGVETAVSTPFPSLQRAYTNPNTLTTADAKTLQRTLGNQAVRRLALQRKMTLGPVGDNYEQEADAVAKQVVSNLHATSAQTAPAQTAQRQEEEEALQMKPLPTISSLQRQEEEEELQAKGDAMLAGGQLSVDVETAVSHAKSGGQPLNQTIRTPMEQAFGTDFSRVKVHTDSQADTLNRSLSARAFTTGQDIFFRQGEYSPGNSGGQELLAHELTHVVQQSGGGVQRKLYKDADTPLEEEHYEKLKELLPHLAKTIDDFLKDEERYLISSFLYDYEIEEAVTINGTTYTAQEELTPEKEPETATKGTAPVAAETTPPVVAPPSVTAAPKDVKLGTFLKTLGYLGSDPRVRTHLGSIPNGFGKSAAVHATQYLANTSQEKITKGTAINTIMNDVFGGAPPLAHHVTAEVHGEKAPKLNPHLFYTGDYTANTPQDVKREDMEKLLKEERERIETILKRPGSAMWT